MLRASGALLLSHALLLAAASSSRLSLPHAGRRALRAAAADGVRGDPGPHPPPHPPTPSLRSPLPAPPPHPQSFAPERDTFSFTGVTPTGFVEYSYDALIKNTTVRLADYAPTLATSAVACAPGAAGALSLSLSVPAAAPDAAHFAARLRAGHVLVLDDAALAGAGAVLAAGECARAAAAARPYYHITTLAARAGEGATLYEVDLVPAAADDVFHALALSLDWNPDTRGALAERRAAGRALGDPAAVAAFEDPMNATARALFSEDLASLAFELNYNAETRRALDPTLRLIPSTDDLNCDNCFVQLAVGVRLDLAMCFRAPGVTAGNTWDLDGGLNAVPLPAACQGFTSVYDASVSLSIVAYGRTSGNLGLASSGIAKSYTSCATRSLADGIADAVGAPLDGCVTNVVPDALQDVFVLRPAGIKITAYLYLGLDAAVLVPAPFPGALSASASFAYEAELGATLSFPSIASSATPLVTPISTLSAKSTTPTFAVTAFTGTAGAIDLVVVPRFTVSVWDVIPFLSLRPSTRFLAAVGAGSTTGGTGAAASAPGAQSTRVQSAVLAIRDAGAALGGSTNGITVDIDVSGSRNFNAANVVARLFGTTWPFSDVQYGVDTPLTAPSAGPAPSPVGTQSAAPSATPSGTRSRASGSSTPSRSPSRGASASRTPGASLSRSPQSATRSRSGAPSPSRSPSASPAPGALWTASFPSTTFVGTGTSGTYRVWLYDTQRAVFSSSYASVFVPPPGVVLTSSASSFPLTGGSTSLTIVLEGATLPAVFNVYVTGLDNTIYQTTPYAWPSGLIAGQIASFPIDDQTDCGAIITCAGTYYIQVCALDSITGAALPCNSVDISLGVLLNSTDNATARAPSAPKGAHASVDPLAPVGVVAALAASPRALYAPTPNSCVAPQLAYSLAMSSAVGVFTETVSYDSILGTFSRSLIGYFTGNLITARVLVTPFTVTTLADIGGGCVGPPLPTPSPGPPGAGAAGALASLSPAVIGGAAGAGAAALLAAGVAAFVCRRQRAGSVRLDETTPIRVANPAHKG